jgi:hypothetical protein
VLILRIRQAEVALHDGRLDESYEIAQRPDVRSHRRGQSLIGDLARALVKRGQSHLDANRLSLALTDCEKASRLAGNLPEVAELHEAATRAAADEQRAARRNAVAFAAAREHIEHGRLSTGERMLAAMRLAGQFESRAAVLMQDLDVKRSALETALRGAAAAIDRADLDVAVRELVKARNTDAADVRIADVVAEVTDSLRSRLSEAVNSGRLDIAATVTRQLAMLNSGDGPDATTRAVEQCKQAWAKLENSEPREAGEILRRLAIQFPKASWIGAAVKQIKQVEEAMDELRTGPLSLAAPTHGSPTEMPPPRTTGYQPVAAVALKNGHGLVTRGTESADLPQRFMLRVDGGGSFCVLRSPVVRVGSVSSSDVPDLGLIAEPALPGATISRADEGDYFVRGATIAVNDQAVGQKGKLLTAGDRVALSPRCRMTFLHPSPASTSAVLDLSGARYPRSEVRRAILLDRDLIIGPGNGTHVRVEHASENIVLHVRSGRLFVESKQPVEVNGSPLDRASGIPLGAHVKVGAVSFVVSRD